MGASSGGDGGEAGEAVADDGRGGIEALLGEGRDGGAAETGDAPEFQADGLALRRRLDSGDEGRLAGSTASTLATRPFAAEVGVVDLDAP